MSGIVGIIYPDKRPVESKLLEQMTAKLAHREPDGIDIWYRGGVGLGHLMLRTKPESVWEQLPLVNARGDLVLTADARIDNRDELIDSLKLENNVTDSQIILARVYWMLFLFHGLGPMPCTVVVRRETLDEVGLFDRTVTVREDYDLWLRVVENKKWLVHYLDEPLAMYRISEMNSFRDRERILRKTLRVKEKAIDRNPDYRRLAPHLLKKGFYKLYFNLANMYLKRSEGEKAREVIRPYRQARHLYSSP